MNTARIGDFLNRYKDVTEIDDNTLYKRVTIRTRNQGVSLRDEVYGSEIGTKVQFKIRSSQFILSKIDARLGAFGIVPETLDGAIATPDFPVFEFNLDIVNPVWFNLFTSTAKFIEICKAASRGVTNRQRLSEDFFLNYQILLPAKPEQDKIVARLQSLQALHREADDILARLRADVKRLRQSILQEAIQGKLVDYKPVPGEKTGAELLADIRAEKERRAREAGKKPDKPLPPVTPEEMPFEVPEGWVWCRLGEVAFVTKLAGFEFTEYFDLKTTGEVPVVRAQNVKPYRLEKSNLLYISKEISEYLWRSELTKPCLLITFIGAGIGEVAPFEEKERWHLAPNVAKAEILHPQINLKFLLHFLLSSEGGKQLFKHRKQTSQPSLSMESIRDAFIPLPPDIEQNLIVRAIEARFIQLDQLDQQLTALQTKTERLWKSELQQAFKFENAG